MWLSYVSMPSNCFTYFTTRIVTGKIMISYNVFNIIWVSIIRISSCTGIIPANAMGKKMSESTPSPANVETMARTETATSSCS